MITVGSYVVPKFNPKAEPAKVLAIDDLGHGKGNERVEISLKFLLFGESRRYYPLKELTEAPKVVSQKCVQSPDGEFLLEFTSETGRVIQAYSDTPLCLTSKEEALKLLENTQDKMDKTPEKVN